MLITLRCCRAMPVFSHSRLLGGVAGFGAFKRCTRAKNLYRDKKRLRLPPPSPRLSPKEPIAKTLSIDLIRLELGYALLALINSERATFNRSDQGPQAAIGGATWVLSMPPCPFR